MSDSPFVGPRPFEKEDSDRFFGRTRETEELLSLIIAHRAVLVYAQSGAGKSSLMRAGVINRLEEQHYPVLRSARVHGLLPNDVPPESVQNIFVYHALQYWAATLPSGQSIKDHAKTTLSDFLRLVVTSPEPGEDGPPPLIVIFDQFEEFFTTNAHRWQERRPFFDQLAQALHELPTMKVVFVMREEYIAQIEPFAELLPEKLRPRMHLERLRGNAARNAVVKPFQNRGLSFDPNAADELMAELSEIRVAEGDKFRETRGEFVEPVQLQVVCQSLWENLPAEWKNGPNASSDGPRLITAEFIERFGDVDNALSCYYDRSVERAAAASEGRIGEGELRRWFGTALITPTGTRGLAFRGAPGAPWRIPGLALKELEEAHVIRREDRSGTITHELTHDRFIEPIQNSNEVWLARYQEAERIRAKLEEYVKRESEEPLDEVELREAEEYLNSPAAKILGASPEARQLIKRSRKELDEAKKRQAEELEEAQQRAREQERLRKAESERLKLLLEKRKRERIFGVIVFLCGMTILVALAGLGYVLNQKRLAAEQTAAELKERGKRLREKAKADKDDETNPIQHLSALRNLSAALNLNPQDTEAAKLARDLLLQRIWCPPAESDVRYQKDALLAATFVRGESNNEIFAVSGDGQLLTVDWGKEGKERALLPVKTYGKQGHDDGSLFKKPEADDQNVVQPGFASFSPDGQWLLTIPPTSVSAATADAAAQGGTQQRAPTGRADGGLEPCNVQIWRWSAQKHTYESAGADFKIQRFRGSLMMNFAWSDDSDQVVLISRQSGAYNAKCNLFRVEGNSVEEIPNGSEQLTGLKIVAIAFSPDRSRLAAVSSQRKVLLIRRDDFRVIPSALDATPLPEGFQPMYVAFGPGDDELTLTSWGGIRILNIQDGKLRVPTHPRRTFRDQFMRMVTGSGDFATRLTATSLNGRVEVAKSARMEEPAEPVVFRGSMGIPQFSPDGKRLLILSGGLWNVYDTIRLIDVSPFYRRQESAAENFQPKSAPTWLAEIASAVSAFDLGGDGSLLTLETVRKRHPESKAGDPYEAVWKRFFPDDRSTQQR
jgi:hypothetical protein